MGLPVFTPSWRRWESKESVCVFVCVCVKEREMETRMMSEVERQT